MYRFTTNLNLQVETHLTLERAPDTPLDTPQDLGVHIDRSLGQEILNHRNGEAPQNQTLVPIIQVEDIQTQTKHTNIPSIG